MAISIAGMAFDVRSLPSREIPAKFQANLLIVLGLEAANLARRKGRLVKGFCCALFLPPPIRRSACKPHRPIKPCDLIVRFGLNRAEWHCGASITMRLGWRLGKQAS